jgi:hypothetical protein
LEQRRRAERDDERVEAEPHDQGAVDDADEDAGADRRGDRDADRDVVLDVEHGDDHRRDRQGPGDREVVVAGGERHQQPEREHDQHRLRPEDRLEVGRGQERVRAQDPEQHDDEHPGSEERVALGDATGQQ